MHHFTVVVHHVVTTFIPCYLRCHGKVGNCNMWSCPCFQACQASRLKLTGKPHQTVNVDPIMRSPTSSQTTHSNMSPKVRNVLSCYCVCTKAPARSVMHCEHSSSHKKLPCFKVTCSTGERCGDCLSCRLVLRWPHTDGLEKDLFCSEVA